MGPREERGRKWISETSFLGAGPERARPVLRQRHRAVACSAAGWKRIVRHIEHVIDVAVKTPCRSAAIGTAPPSRRLTCPRCSSCPVSPTPYPTAAGAQNASARGWASIFCALSPPCLASSTVHQHFHPLPAQVWTPHLGSDAGLGAR